MKCLLQLLYDITVRECELPFDLRGFTDVRAELKRSKGKPLYEKPVLFFDGKPVLIVGLQQAPGGKEYFSTIDNRLAIPVEDEHKADRKLRMIVNTDSIVSERDYLHASNNNGYISKGVDTYNPTVYNIEFFDRLLLLSVHQYHNRFELWSSGHIISTKYK